MPVAEPCDLLAREAKITGAVVEHDEVIARAVHLDETQLRHERF